MYIRIFSQITSLLFLGYPILANCFTKIPFYLYWNWKTYFCINRMVTWVFICSPSMGKLLPNVSSYCLPLLYNNNPQNPRTSETSDISQIFWHVPTTHAHQLKIWQLENWCVQIRIQRCLLTFWLVHFLDWCQTTVFYYVIILDLESW